MGYGIDMFTGIIQSLGAIQAIESRSGDARFTLQCGELKMDEVALGDSIAVNGVCLTVVEKKPQSFVADVSGETLSRTTLGSLKVASVVNLEMAMTPTMRLGGHLVSGHVDGVGKVLRRWSDGCSERFVVKAPDNLAKYIAEKGSICIDGISLTVNRVDGSEFELNIVPHTLQVTSMGQFVAGTSVNLEVDIIARYLERLMLGDTAASKNAATGGVTAALLQENGFFK
jgi:riboflavin synthase